MTEPDFVPTNNSQVPLNDEEIDGIDEDDNDEAHESIATTVMDSVKSIISGLDLSFKLVIHTYLSFDAQLATIVPS